ncbi:MAG TPA: MFS transporter [Acidimicrobiales bacterium]
MVALLRGNRDLRLLFFAQVVSYLGDWFADVALLGLVLDLSDSPLAAGGLMVATMLPVFLVTPLAGPMVDRLDRRRLVIAVSLCQCLFALTLLAVSESTLWLAFLARAGVAALGAFVAPAAQAAIPNLVEPEDLPRANALLGSVWGAMLAVGAAVGGAFAVAFGRDAAFVADAATFVVAAALIAGVRRPMNAPRPAAGTRLRPIADTVDAVRYAAGHRPVLLLLFSKTGLGLAGGVVPLLAVYGTDVFHGGDAAIGLLLAARGMGALLGPLFARRHAARGTPTILLVCGAAGLVYGIGYLGVAASPVLGVALVAAFVAHLGGGAQWTLSNIGLQSETPDELRGRIFAADFALVTLTMSTSFLLSGWGSDTFGPRPVTVALALVASTWGVAYLTLTRTIRRPEPVHAGALAGADGPPAR